jgi:trimeric autotransporter adhesin
MKKAFPILITIFLMTGFYSIKAQITGSGTSGNISKFTGANSIGNSIIFESGSNIGIGTATPNEQLAITANFSIPVTTATTGIIKLGTDRFIHAYGTGNFFAGKNAGNLSFTGTNNVGIGVEALKVNTSGSYNSASGSLALWSNTTGSTNTALGYAAMYTNTGGGHNVAIGNGAGYYNATGNYNAFVGEYAGRYSLANNNTYIGYGSGQGTSSTTSAAINNAGLGFQSLLSITTGYSNTALGYQGLYSLNTGYSNTTMGYAAGYRLTTGNGNIFIGKNAGYSTSQKVDAVNSMALGSDVFTTENNQYIYGNASVAKHIFQGGNVGIGTTYPTHLLDVRGDASFTVGEEQDAFLVYSGPNEYNLIRYNGDVDKLLLMEDPTSGSVGIGTSAPVSKLGIMGNASIGTTYAGINAPASGLIVEGKVGIGTTNPQDKLDINGSLSITGNGSTGASGINGQKTSGVFTVNANTGSYNGPNIEMNGMTKADNPGRLRFISYGTGTDKGDILFTNYDNAAQSWNDKMIITANGNVGIGTNYPLNGVHIKNNTATSTNLWLDATNISGGVNWMIQSTCGSNSLGQGKLVFRDETNAKDLLTIYSTASTYPGVMSFNGKIYAQEVEVKLGAFPDYVFQKEYNLMSIDNLQNYIEKNGHLPNMASKEDVEKNGIGIGEMNRVLLEKVEELSLYLIEQNKLLKEQQQQINQLENKVSNIK